MNTLDHQRANPSRGMPPMDMRSDAVTQPTEGMWQAMRAATPGWAPTGEDTSVRALEQLAAELTGKDAAMFVPTGTMANLLALMSSTDRGDQIILDTDSHILWSEEAGLGHICGLVPCAIKAHDGCVPVDAIREKLAGYRFNHKFHTSLVCIENTHNLSGGRIVNASQITDIASVAHEYGATVHIDGARIFNASIAAGQQVKTMVAAADTLMFCLSKGLSAPAGAVLCGPAQFVAKSATHLKRLGGSSIPQLGILAAAGLEALKTMPDQLIEDHRRAKLLADGLTKLVPSVCVAHKVETNIVIATLLRSGPTAAVFVERLAAHGVLAYKCTSDRVRFVTHRHIDDEAIDLTIKASKIAARQ